MRLSNEVYDFLVLTAMFFLPAIGTFSEEIWEIWGLPYNDKIPRTITAIITLLGVFLKHSSAKYYKDLAEQTDDKTDVEDIEHQAEAEDDTDKG